MHRLRLVRGGHRTDVTELISVLVRYFERHDDHHDTLRFYFDPVWTIDTRIPVGHCYASIPYFMYCPMFPCPLRLALAVTFYLSIF